MGSKSTLRSQRSFDSIRRRSKAKETSEGFNPDEPGSSAELTVDSTDASAGRFGHSEFWALLGLKNSDDFLDDRLLSDRVREFVHQSRVSALRIYRQVKREPGILLWSVAIFLLLSCTGLFIVANIAHGLVYDKMTEATEIAKSAVEAFSESLDLAILPLFSLSQFVFEIDELRELAGQIGQVGVEGSLPLLQEDDGHPTHRNITGVCDRPHLQRRYSDIAGLIKKNAKMDGVLVNIQLAPMATVCLVHPINNTEDFEDGVFLDSSGAIGHDLLTDPRRKFIAEATLPAHRVVTAGPLSLVQCKDCSPTVERAFIARLPIYMDGHSITLDDGSEHNAWGFAVALINWQELIDRSNIMELFQNLRMGFELTRTDMTYDPETDTYTKKVVHLADLDAELLTDDSVTVDLETTDNQWEIRVGFTEGIRPKWVLGARLGVVFFSSLVFWLLFSVLVSRQAHKALLRDIFPPRALRKLNKDEIVIEEYQTPTVFFSDIVGYTNISSELSAFEVMEMLHAFYAMMDTLVDEYGVYKLETVGDAFMVMGGAPDRCSGPEGAEKVARFALAAIEMVKSFVAPSGIQIHIRAGLNSGPLCAGVVGTKKPHYTVFGDTVNVSSRMESTSTRMNIQISKSTCEFLREAPNYEFDMPPRGLVDIKGKGKVRTWWLKGAKERSHAPHKALKPEEIA